MKYYSINNRDKKVDFQKGTTRGIASDQGLYFPESIPKLNHKFIENIKDYSHKEIAFKAIKPFIGNNIPDSDLKQIIEETLYFDFPLIEIEKNIFSAELFHGPSLAFKDVGARFMARCIQYFNKNKTDKTITILVATSGDTGSAVANGFLDIKGTKIILLYPSKKVSPIQEKQLTTLGKNITALEVYGSFDDCQRMVKKAFFDPALERLNLTSANSINIARWLPQVFYFFFAYKEVKIKNKPIAIAVPSGNFGNIGAGLIAKKMGLPIDHFIAATNINDTVLRFFNTGKYEPLPAIETLSNAMDVGDPSNFIRIRELYQNKEEELKKDLSVYSFTDLKTKEVIKSLYKKYNYIADPHGAVGYLGLKSFLKDKTDYTGIFLETAHPIKFLDIIEPILSIKMKIPLQIRDVLSQKKQSTIIYSYQDLKKVLLE